jgi:hypothetical protein
VGLVSDSISGGNVTTQPVTWPSSMTEATQQTSHSLPVMAKTSSTLTVTLPKNVITRKDLTSIPTMEGTYVLQGSFTTALVAGKSYTLRVKLRATKWAGSNIYWDTNHLTFDPYQVDGSQAPHKGYQAQVVGRNSDHFFYLPHNQNFICINGLFWLSLHFDNQVIMAIIKDHKIAIKQLLGVIPEALLSHLSENTKVDYYSKVPHGKKLFYLLMYGILENDRLSQRSLEDAFNDPVFKMLFNLNPDESVRQSSISERLSKIDSAFFKQIYECIYEQFSNTCLFAE